jgi:hypothetical protein
MDKISVIIADPDERYTSILASFVRSGDYANQFSLACFTQPEALNQVIRQIERSWSLYVVHESLAASIIPMIGDGELVLLCEQAVSEEGGIDKRIAKYQPLNQFFAKLKSFCVKETDSGGMWRYNRERCRASTIYSAAGGAGKTTVAVNLAAQWAQKGKNVFLLSLEPFPSYPWIENLSRGAGLSRFLYYVRSQHQQLPEKLEQCKSYDPSLKLSCFAPPDNLLELEEMTEEDVAGMIRCVRGSGVYDELLIDLGSGLHKRVLGALGECDRICWLVVDDAYCRAKTNQALRRLAEYEKQAEVSIIGKIGFWQNKCLDMHSANFGEKVAIEGGLPYIPEWKSASGNPRPLLDSLQFNECLSAMAAEGAMQGVKPNERRLDQEIQARSCRAAGPVGPAVG